MKNPAGRQGAAQPRLKPKAQIAGPASKSRRKDTMRTNNTLRHRCRQDGGESATKEQEREGGNAEVSYDRPLLGFREWLLEVDVARRAVDGARAQKPVQGRSSFPSLTVSVPVGRIFPSGSGSRIR